MPHKLLDEIFTSKVETYSQGFYINNLLLLDLWKFNEGITSLIKGCGN